MPGKKYTNMIVSQQFWLGIILFLSSVMMSSSLKIPLDLILPSCLWYKITSTRISCRRRRRTLRNRVKSITPCWINTWIFLPRRRRVNFKRFVSIASVCISSAKKCKTVLVVSEGWWPPGQRESEFLRILSGVRLPDPPGSGQEEVWCCGAGEWSLWSPTLPLCCRIRGEKVFYSTQQQS